MKKSKAQQSKLTKNDLVREMASIHLGIAAFSISESELDNYCKEMVNWRTKNNGKGLYKDDKRTYKDDFANIIEKYNDIAKRESLSLSIGEKAFKLTKEEFETIQDELANILITSSAENLEFDFDAIMEKYK